ncbi:MAG: glycoside hydrolase [Acidobacteria bacterium]|nr:glycoside hydrolase [Acidobacteriota bacterium]MCI0720941.1 glycoside hydrolase [Acidobacteriota bacterium]
MRAVPAERLVVAQGGYFPRTLMLKNGEILATFKTGAPHVGKAGRASMSRSLDGGKNWSPPQTVFDLPEADDSTDLLGQLKDGTVLFAAVSYTWFGEKYNQNEGWKADVYVIRSQDNGKSWSKPVKANTAPYQWAYPYGRLIELTDGTLLMTCYGGYYPYSSKDTDKPPEKQGRFSFLIRSRDGGKSWGEHSLVAQHYNETTAVLLPSGRLLAALRPDERGVPTDISFSDDKGFTWTKPQQVLNSSEHPADLLLLKSGTLLMSFGVRRKPYGVQAILSRDEGKTWQKDSPFLLAWDGDHEDVGYPISVERSDGKILTLYYVVYGERDFDGDKGVALRNSYTKAVIWAMPRLD